MEAKPVIHNTITQDGISTEMVDLHAQDSSDAQVLISSDAWKRFFVRRINQKIDGYKTALAELKSDNVADFKAVQARIEELKEILRMPDQTIVSLKKK